MKSKKRNRFHLGHPWVIFQRIYLIRFADNVSEERQYPKQRFLEMRAGLLIYFTVKTDIDSCAYMEREGYKSKPL